MIYTTYILLFPEEVSSARSAIDFYLMLQAASAGVLLLITFLYLPERPLVAPSVAAVAERHPFIAGVKAISKFVLFWLSTRNFILRKYDITTGSISIID